MIGSWDSDTWIADIKQRANVIRWDEESRKLRKLNEKLEKLKSEDARTAEALADISALLD